MNSSILTENLISDRYVNDGKPILKSDQVAAQEFLADPRIHYKEVDTCPLCEHREAICIAKKDRHGLPLDTIVCKQCGLIRSHKQLNERSSIIFYREYYRRIYDAAEDYERRYSGEAGKNPPKFLSKEQVILEIGCGGGWNLMPFHKNGYIYYGYDFDKDLIEYGRLKGLNLFVGGISEARHRGIRADYLILDQVLEHVSDPCEFLVELKSVLNENALVNIHLPSVNLLLWGYSDYDLLGTLQNAHNFLFDDFTLKTIAKKTGFLVENCAANNIILRYTERITPQTLAINSQRGEKVVRFLKLVEFTLRVRRRIGLLKPIKKFYFFANPIGALKRAKIEYL